MKLAVDVVLLPPEDVMDKAIELNKKMEDTKIPLNKENCLPHISLAMGCVAEEDINSIGKILDVLGKMFLPMDLLVEKTSFGKRSGTFHLNIIKIPELQKLHENVMNNLKTYLEYDIDREMFYSPSEINDKTINWTKGYRKTAFENFKPHITIGQGKGDADLPIKFTSNRLALCQLGNYCTCRKILYEFKI